MYKETFFIKELPKYVQKVLTKRFSLGTQRAILDKLEVEYLHYVEFEGYPKSIFNKALKRALEQQDVNIYETYPDKYLANDVIDSLDSVIGEFIAEQWVCPLIKKDQVIYHYRTKGLSNCGKYIGDYYCKPIKLDEIINYVSFNSYTNALKYYKKNRFFYETKEGCLDFLCFCINRYCVRLSESFMSYLINTNKD